MTVMVDVTVILPLLKGKDMPNSCPTVKVMPWSESQGDFVEINEEDFDEKVHVLYNEDAPKAKKAKAIKLEAPIVEAAVEAPKPDANAGWGSPE